MANKFYWDGTLSKVGQYDFVTGNELLHIKIIIFPHNFFTFMKFQYDILTANHDNYANPSGFRWLSYGLYINVSLIVKLQ